MINYNVLITGNIYCMEKFLFQMNQNWAEDFKYIQPMCAMTKYGMRYFYIVENNNKMRDIFKNFHDLMSDGISDRCTTEIIGINPDFKGDLQEKIDKLLDNFFMEEDDEFDNIKEKKM